MLTQFGPEIWLCDGPVVTAAAGFHYPTRMVVIRLADGRLVLWSPVAFSDALATALAALGPIGFIVAPNTLHHTFFAQWQGRFPDATALGAPELAELKPDLHFDGNLGDASDRWGGDIDLVTVGGNRITTEIVAFHRLSRTAIFTDLLQQFQPGWFHGWRALVARLDLMVGTEPAVPRKFRVAFTDRKLARHAVDQILAWPTERLVMAHGTPALANGHSTLRRAFAWLR